MRKECGTREFQRVDPSVRTQREIEEEDEGEYMEKEKSKRGKKEEVKPGNAAQKSASFRWLRDLGACFLIPCKFLRLRIANTSPFGSSMNRSISPISVSAESSTSTKYQKILFHDQK